jgi:MtN3 and saliva related transmembrane protein
MDWISLLGFLAAAGTTAAFLPQAIKAWKTRATRDISLLMYLVFMTGVVLWMIYGILISDYPVTIANAVTLLLAAIILAAKLRFG